MRSLLVACIFAALAAHGSPARAAEYVIGSVGYPSLASVPWNTLAAGDIVTIPYSASPYRETFAITTSGTSAMPITVRGVAGPGGERPIIDGQNAVQGADTHVRGLLSIRNGASNIVVEGLAFRHAHADYAHAGLFPGMNASGIYLEDGAHVTVRDCEFYGNGNGFFTAPGTVDIHFERNEVYGNGNVNSLFEHNSYTESDGIVFEGNHYGPLLAGARGTNLKDRSAGTIIRYNFLEGGNRVLDLVEADNPDPDLVTRVATTPTYVYGNVLVKRDETTQSQVVHFGGDNGDTATYRRYLFFYGNTVYSTRATRTTLFHFDADAPVTDIRNSIFVVSASTQNYLLDSSTTAASSVHVDHVYLPTGWSISVEPLLTPTVNSTAITTGSAPGFVDASMLDFHLAPSASVRNGGTSLAPGSPTVLLEYLASSATVARQVDGVIDLGAFEVCEAGCMPAVPMDAGVPEIDAGQVVRADGGSGLHARAGGCDCSVGSESSGADATLFTVVALGLALCRRRATA